MIEPMLAIPMDKADIKDWNDWAVEEKFDGHRLIVQVSREFGAHGADVRAWTRPRKHAGGNGKTMATRELPMHLRTDFALLPEGIYDGELIGGDTSTDVTRTDLQHTLRFVVFDVLRIADANVMCYAYDKRRQLLCGLFDKTRKLKHVALAESVNVTGMPDVVNFASAIWKRGGEGAMLKRRTAPYQPGKRSKDLVKIKKLQTNVGTVVRFEPTKGKVLRRGIFASVVVRDDDGNETSFKTKDDAELDAFRRKWDEAKRRHNLTPANEREELKLANMYHPDLGRKIRFEYQDFTPRGGYRHPRWDRWEDE